MSQMVAFCRAYRRKMAGMPFHWLEAHCAPGFERSRRWLELLGFRPLGLTLTMNDGTVLRRFVYQRFPQ
jgi:RimJ/RimL family protein N-acetyltransferase